MRWASPWRPAALIAPRRLTVTDRLLYPGWRGVLWALYLRAEADGLTWWWGRPLSMVERTAQSWTALAQVAREVGVAMEAYLAALPPPSTVHDRRSAADGS